MNERVKDGLRKLLIKCGLFPRIFNYPNSLKIFEFKELLKNIEIRDCDEILDIGCGTGLQSFILGKRSRHLTGIDISKSAIRRANENSKLLPRIPATFVCGDLLDVKFQSHAFDKIFSICVIEHIPHYHKILLECMRLLKPGGSFVCSVDSLETITDPILIQKHQADHKVVHYFTRQELTRVLEECGFTNIEVYPIFRSRYARSLFTRGIRNDFEFNPILSMLCYPIVVACEGFSKADRGIFLVAKCNKPAIEQNHYPIPPGRAADGLAMSARSV
jgi:2-polyprenyl-3-methyl-5-hydroxy-6-metoxy-1,4-benzoquinol methylase